MKIENGRVAIIHYTLKNAEGKVMESSSGQDPMGYIHGENNIIPGLERALEGRLAGIQLNVVIPPHEAYGMRDEQLIRDVPIEQFGSSVTLEPGTHLQVESQEGIQVVTVLQVQPDSVKVDFNHPLAGETLYFDIEILEVRAATAAELDHGHVHGAGGHHH
jgi:FKBP-type peptidyl-prolyl cis-trans isomerase SlyD